MKVMCPNCNKIIDVIEEDGKDSSFCSTCGYSFKISEAKDLLIKRYKEIHKQAYNCVYVQMDYEDGYELYKECLKYRDNDLTAITGMCLAKLYSQTFDNLEFRNVVTIFDEYNIVLNEENTYVFLCFIKDCLTQIDYYLDEVETRLMKDKLVFYKKEYFDWFIEGVKQIEDLLHFFDESLPLLEEEEYKSYLEQNPNFSDNLEKHIEDFKKYEIAFFDVYGVGKVNFLGDVVKKKDNYDISEIPELADKRIIVPKQDVAKKTYIFGGVIIGLIAIALIMMIVGIAIEQYIVTYVGLVPLVVAIVILLYYYFKGRKIEKKEKQVAKEETKEEENDVIEEPIENKNEESDDSSK